jgi:hypothetical protein
MWKYGLIFTAIFAGSAYAQGGARGPFGGQRIRIIGAQPGRPGQVVKGSPYTADVSTEITQTLPDGNKIQQTASERVYRDSEGRTRREPSLSGVGVSSPAGGSAQLAFIDDPVASASYVLDLQKRTATKMPWRPPPQNGGRGQQARTRQTDPNRKIESLGRQIIAGLPADGTRITQTIPAGQIGNTLPIQVVTERWYSSDLQAVILQKRTDPRSGEYVYQWQNIIRAEPSPTLFSPPADFPLTEGRGPRARGQRNASAQ